MKLIELGDELPMTARENLKEIVHRKLKQVNDMKIPNSVNEHLQRKHLISEKNSRRYVQEYKKYLMCALVSQKAVTPSEGTDLVWHTHLCTNNIYPIQMAKVMPKYRKGRFDHGPTKGGNAEGMKYDEQYKRTVELGEYLFGPLPQDIWEPGQSRFYPTLFCMYHVDLRRLANYMIAVEKARASIDPALLPAPEEEQA